MKWLVLVGVIGVAIAGFARPAAAQDVKRVEVAGGWNYMAARSNDDNDWTHFLKGWFGEVAGGLNSRWSIVGQVSGGYKTILDNEGAFKLKVHPYLFGVRASARRNPKTTPFAHFLVGATNIKVSLASESVSDTLFTWQAGGGVNVKINDSVGARIGGDYVRIKGTDDSEIVSEAIQVIRLSVGVVVGF